MAIQDKLIETKELISLEQSSRYFKPGYLPGLYERFEGHLKQVWEKRNQTEMLPTNKTGMLWVMLENDPLLSDSVNSQIVVMRGGDTTNTGVTSQVDMVLCEEKDLTEPERRESRLVLGIIKKYTEAQALFYHMSETGNVDSAKEYKVAGDEIYQIMDSVGMSGEADLINLLFQRINTLDIEL